VPGDSRVEHDSYIHVDCGGEPRVLLMFELDFCHRQQYDLVQR